MIMDKVQPQMIIYPDLIAAEKVAVRSARLNAFQNVVDLRMHGALPVEEEEIKAERLLTLVQIRSSSIA